MYGGEIDFVCYLAVGVSNEMIFCRRLDEQYMKITA